MPYSKGLNPFRRRTEPRETTGFDLAQHHSIIVEQHAAERAELVARHAQDRKALLEDVEARHVTLSNRIRALVLEDEALLPVVEALR